MRLGGSSLGGEQVPPTPNSQHIVGGGGQSGGQARAPGKSAAEFENERKTGNALGKYQDRISYRLVPPFPQGCVP